MSSTLPIPPATFLRTVRILNNTIVGVVVAVLIGCSTAVFAANAGDTKVSFNEQIRPIFTRHCVECHGGVKDAAGLSFAFSETILPPDGYVVVPGDAEGSPLFERITSDDAELRMPPSEHGPPLSADEILLVKMWINEGAPWETVWSFAAPETQAIPDVDDEDWCRQEFDHFILAELQRHKIKPGGNEHPDRWLRRVTLDLVGLPPTPAERAAFLADLESNGEQAYAAVVDRLLASPHFGERWATMWLDQVRYADSRGLGYDLRRHAWKYRDWVVSAFNSDLPYDKFTIMQLAGDQLENPTMEDIVATACHRMSQSNDEGGSDDEMFRMEAVLERTDTTWQTWAGLTFACARCHDHPYEPIRQREYYEFSAFFNNSRDSDLYSEHPLKSVPLSTDDYERAQHLDQQIETLERQVWEFERQVASESARWQPLDLLTATTNTSTQIEVGQRDGRSTFWTVGTIASNTDFTVDAAPDAECRQVSALRVHCLPADLDVALRDSEWGFVLSHVKLCVVVGEEEQELPLAHVIGDEFDPFLDPQESLNPESNSGFSAYTRIHHPRSVVFVLAQAAELPKEAILRVTLSHRRQYLASFSLTTRQGYFEVSDDPALVELLADEQRSVWLKQLARLRKARSRISSTPLPVMQERADELARPTHVLERGSQLNKAEQVTAGVPASMPPLPIGEPASRLAMAHWLVSGDHPLTARVAVNRIWARLFGTGIVATEEDFGSTGQAPSHPELLDYLALRFQNELAWSTKQLIREIVLSSTYRQSAKARADLVEIDPENRLLARGPRMPLTAEMVRDQALAASGLLTRNVGGPPVYPPLPKGVWRPFQGSDRWETPPRGDPDRYRRAIYTYCKRSIPYPLMTAFNAPTREVCTPRRPGSNTPVQALMQLNDAAVHECAEHLAAQMQRSDATLDGQIQAGFLRVICRPPTGQELDDLRRFVANLPESNDHHKSLTLLASLILNLDEAVTK